MGWERIDTRHFAWRLLMLSLVCVLMGQGRVESQGVGSPASFRAIPLFSSKRANLEIEIVTPGGSTYRIYLLDRARNEPLPSNPDQKLPARRVYQFEDLSADFPPVACLDDQCNLYVMIRSGGKINVRCYNPRTGFSPAFQADEIKNLDAWVAALGAVDQSYRFANGLLLFGKDDRGALQKVSTDELIPERVKEEQRVKLHREIVALLNRKLGAWSGSLDELLPLQAKNHPVQEVWLARAVRDRRDGIKKGAARTEEYWHQLRLLNRIVLGDMLSDRTIDCRLQTCFPLPPG